MTTTDNRATDVAHLPAGTFAPAPGRAGVIKMVLAQGRIESLLFLRHGEQQLLSLVIPVAMLLGLTFLPLEWPMAGSGDPLDRFFPVALAIAATSSGFTGQAISLAFDRRYGALKRTGASGVPAWTIIAGKAIAVAATALVQTLLLGAIALALGWRTDLTGALLGLVTIVIGAAAFTAMGLLMGGTLSSELVLGLANLIWVALIGVTGYVLYVQGLDAASWWDVVPSVAMASGLTVAFSGGVPWVQWLILAAWAAAASAACTRWFRFAG
ncbi:ABC transporter permease [Corynebacterium frankenforstense]|uniref:ABC transporter permease n=1 Tax=Corynebacterium TaxID=1716 RepID=UPI00254ADDF1|nr:MULTISPECIES: ABC transporter permease [Corynebacterium]MDK6260121.1 ABC transporter permease [Corynebacterium frankenforstense]MDK8895925.1 ABC transporter permease [Corynebacterium sp. MSK006]